MFIILNSEEIIEKFMLENKHRRVDTFDVWIQDIEPNKIKGINYPYSYPEILDDYKMEKLKSKIQSKEDWDMSSQLAWTLNILKFPNGDLVVNGNGNHRAVLSKELQLEKIKANVREVRYLD